MRTTFLFYLWSDPRQDGVRVGRCDGQRQKTFSADSGLQCRQNQRGTKLAERMTTTDAIIPLRHPCLFLCSRRVYEQVVVRGGGKGED
jgi:hypothetical protein